MQFYARVCISVTFAQCLRNNEVKCAPGGRLQAVWRQVCTASANCKLFGRLAAYIALTAALMRYAKDKGAFISIRQRVGQTIKDLQHSEYAHGCYISLDMP